MDQVRPTNLLILMSDEHNRAMLGCYGHPVVKTPNLDRLAERGVLFRRAYCNCPICVPSRASMATGRYPHQIGTWDNAAPYTGQAPSWGHRLTAQGHHVTTIGKLHYRDDGDDTGFPDQRLSLQVKHGIGDVQTLVRDDMPVRQKARRRVIDAGAGESEYNRYDEAIKTEAVRFLREEAPQFEKPWALFVSFVAPHFPLVVPERYLSLYPPESVVLPQQYHLGERPTHPVLEEFRRVYNVPDEFDEPTIRRALAAYYGLCSFLDDQVGQVLSALKEAGLEESTRVMYTTDHGDTMGDHGLWWKYTMYEGSAGVPLIMAGPEIPAGIRVDTHVSLVDCFPTIIETVGAHLEPEDADLPGMSLWPLLRGEIAPDRTVFSEYHASGAVTGFFMIRANRYKYVYYVGYPPQLFDLETDPGEFTDLAPDPRWHDVLRECEAALRAIVNPEEIDRQARADQERRMKAMGGRNAVLQPQYQMSYSPAPSAFQKSDEGEPQ